MGVWERRMLISSSPILPTSHPSIRYRLRVDYSARPQTEAPMSFRTILLLLVSLSLIGSLAPAVFFRLQQRVGVFLPVRGRWAGPFLWGAASLSFVILLVLANS